MSKQNIEQSTSNLVKTHGIKTFLKTLNAGNFKMLRITIVFISFVFLVLLLVFNTPETRVGSGFIVGDGNHIFTYAGLIHEASLITVKFPNEENIKAETIYIEPENNIGVLKMDKIPKVERTPLVFSNNDLNRENTCVFTFGYPWVNTQADRYRLLEGSLNLSSSSNFNWLQLKMPLESVHSGSPLLNKKGELIGMLIMGKHFSELNKISKNSNYVIGMKVVKNALIKNNLYKEKFPSGNRQTIKTPEYIEGIKSNIVLLEATIN